MSDRLDREPMPDGSTMIGPKAGEPLVCDFCSVEHHDYDYPCENFDLPQFDWGSLGYWAACQLCHDLIEAENWDGVIDRAVEHNDLIEQHPELEEGVRTQLKALHTAFVEHRTGPAERWEGEIA